MWIAFFFENAPLPITFFEHEETRTSWHVASVRPCISEKQTFVLSLANA